MAYPTSQRPNAAFSGVTWGAIAGLICLSVTIFNGAPLYYFDSAGYLDAGLKTARLLDILPPPEAATGAGGGTAMADDGAVNGSRSIFYSILMTFGIYTFGVIAIPLIHVTAVLGITFFLTHILMREHLAGMGAIAKTTALSLGAACLGSLPFFIAYFMPDILVGLLILTIATLTLKWREMRWWDILICLAIGCVAVLAHPSHLVISALMVPLAGIAALLIARRRWWVPVVLVAVMPAAGAGERLLFSSISRSQLDAEVTYFPFLTARLIQDRVGYAYLQEKCPDAEIAACVLYDILSQSDDPLRLTASHIVFETAGELASYQLLPAEAQRAIAAEQVRFAVQVGLSRPFSTAAVILRNTLRQARMNSVRMTVPEIEVIQELEKIAYFKKGTFQPGRLMQDRRTKLRAIDQVHKIYYLLCAAAIVALFVWPGRLRADYRIFILLVLAGMLANAFVCGAISQPAHRYGSRVIWVLPYVTMLMFLLSRPQKPPSTGPA